jgi:hypothetical protein
LAVRFENIDRCEIAGPLRRRKSAFNKVIYGAKIGFLYYIAVMSLLPDRGSDLGDIGFACVEAEFSRMTLTWP